MVTITVTTVKQNRRATVKVKVVDPYKATGIAAPANRTVREGETFTLSYTLTPATATSPVTPTSGSKNVVQVNADGTLTALRPGTATVTLRTSTGRTARTRVTVEKAPEPTATPAPTETPTPTATPVPTETPAPTPAPEYTLDELKARIAANTITSKELTDALAVMVSQGRFGYWEMKLLYDAHQDGFVSDEEYRDFTGKYGGADFKPYDEEALSLTELNLALAAGTLRGDELLDALDKSFAVGKISASQYEEIVHRAYNAGLLNDAQYDRYLESIGNTSSSENTYSAEKMRLLISAGEVKGDQLEEMLARSNNVGKITADEAATLTAYAMAAGLLTDAQYARLVERFGYPSAKPTATPAPGEAFACSIEKLNMLVAAGEAEGDYLYECVRKSLQEGTITKAQGAEFALTMADNGLLTEKHWATLNEEFGLGSVPVQPTAKPTPTPAPGEAFACSIEKLNMLVAAGEAEGDYLYECVRKSLQEGTITKAQGAEFALSMVDNGLLTEKHWATLNEEFGL